MSEAPRPHPRPFGQGPDPATLAGAAAAVLWVVFCILWFDVATPWRPAALVAVSPLAILAASLLAALAWLRGRWGTLAGPPLGAAAHALLLVLALAFFFRLPVVVGGAGAAVTPDGALSGIVALHVANGSERLVFVPQVPYSGSLKSHLTAPLALVLDPARAFALVSVVFYLAHVAGLFRLALLAAGPRAALLAGLYAAFSPAFVTRYSLSNDGNYVEVLALGTWALWLAVRWTREEDARARLAFAAGLLLGLGFWCHILAIIHLAALAALFVLAAVVPGGRRRDRVLVAGRSLLALAVGWAIGYAPGWLWNLANDGESFHYLVPGAARTDSRRCSIRSSPSSSQRERTPVPRSGSNRRPSLSVAARHSCNAGPARSTFLPPARESPVSIPASASRTARVPPPSSAKTPSERVGRARKTPAAGGAAREGSAICSHASS